MEEKKVYDFPLVENYYHTAGVGQMIMQEVMTQNQNISIAQLIDVLIDSKDESEKKLIENLKTMEARLKEDGVKDAEKMQLKRRIEDMQINLKVMNLNNDTFTEYTQDATKRKEEFDKKEQESIKKFLDGLKG